jgi:D-alanyl-D-alanine carboxypeptidase (penicillin-binding protein 5/6)
MLTALVVLDELEPDDVLVIGSEIRNMPSGFATNVHSEGETVTVETLLKSMLIRSSNESGRVFALNVVRRRDGRGVTIDEANSAFSAMLNEKATSLGANGTHFNNAFGHHNENHFTTAHDLVLITRAFMDNPVLAEIAGTRVFENWTNTNQMLPDAPHGYPYMTGAKAGFTTAAGHILAGAAEHNGLQLATVVLGGTDVARWQDTRRLMDYGFTNYSFREIAATGDVIGEVLIENPRLGDDEALSIVLGESENFTALVSHAEYAAITRAITFDPLLYVVREDEYETPTLRAPIEEGAVIGTATYSTNGTVLFEVSVLASRAVYERNFDSDMDYHLAAFFGNVFSRKAVPYYFGVIGTAFGIFGIVIAVRANLRAGRYNRY